MAIHPDAQSDLAVNKKPKPGVRNRIPSRRDVRDLTSEELTGGQFEFFPEDPTDSFLRNYRQPLRPRNRPKVIRGLGFSITRPWIEAATNVSPIALLHNLMHSSVTLLKGERKSEVFSKHMSQFVDAGLFEFIQDAYDDGTNSDTYEAVVATEVPGRVLGNAEENLNYELDPNQEFQLIVEPRNTGSIPAAADYSTVPQILCVMQIEHAPTT